MIHADDGMFLKDALGEWAREVLDKEMGCARRVDECKMQDRVDLPRSVSFHRCRITTFSYELGLTLYIFDHLAIARNVCWRGSRPCRRAGHVLLWMTASATGVDTDIISSPDSDYHKLFNSCVAEMKGAREAATAC